MEKNRKLENDELFCDEIEHNFIEDSLVDIMGDKLRILFRKKWETKEQQEFLGKTLVLGGAGILLLLGASRFIAPLVVPIEVVETVHGSKYNLREIFTTAYNITVVFVISPLLVGINSFKLRCSKKEKKGYESAIGYLESAIMLENSKVEELDNNKVMEDDNKSALRELDKKIRFKYEYGYNEDKYYRYYQRDVLDYKLDGIYSKEELIEIRNSLKERENKKLKKVK